MRGGEVGDNGGLRENITDRLSIFLNIDEMQYDLTLLTALYQKSHKVAHVLWLVSVYGSVEGDVCGLC